MWVIFMSVMDKQSVRKEFDRIKSEFGHISKKQKITPEIKSLFTAMILLMEVVLAIFLEKKTKKTKANSSKPPSQTQKDETSLECARNKLNIFKIEFIVKLLILTMFTY